MTVGRWCGEKARSWEYYHPTDCRPLSKRIHVFLKESGIGSTIKLIEGDGRRSDFKVHEVRELTPGATEAEATAIVAELAPLLVAAAQNDESFHDRLAAGILTSVGFQLDDFFGQEAWLMPGDEVNYTFYIRGAPEPEFVPIGNRTMAVPLIASIHPEMPVEVGIAYDLGSDRSFCIAPCLEEAIRVVQERKLPLPEYEGEAVAVDYDTLFRPAPLSRPRIR
jgi:hypothetical protein